MLSAANSNPYLSPGSNDNILNKTETNSNALVTSASPTEIVPTANNDSLNEVYEPSHGKDPKQN